MVSLGSMEPHVDRKRRERNAGVSAVTRLRTVLHGRQQCNTQAAMKTLTVRLPEALVASIEAESRARKLSKSDVVRERLSRAAQMDRPRPATYEAIADLIGSVKGLPPDLSARKKYYLKAGYGRKRPR